MHDFALGIKRIPDRNRHAEVALTADKPVTIESFDPVGIAMSHVIGVPCESCTASQQFIAQCGVTTAVADVPLTACDNFERTIALFVELHRVRNGARLTDHFTVLHQHRGDCGLCLLRRLANK